MIIGIFFEIDIYDIHVASLAIHASERSKHIQGENLLDGIFDGVDRTWSSV